MWFLNHKLIISGIHKNSKKDIWRVIEKSDTIVEVKIGGLLKLMLEFEGIFFEAPGFTDKCKHDIFLEIHNQFLLHKEMKLL